MAKGLIWLCVIVALFVFTKYNVDRDLILKFEPLFDKTGLILLIYGLSEVIIGIIPPEVFLIWALRTGTLTSYIYWALLLTVISYCAGLVAYFFGRYLHNTLFYKYLYNRFLHKSEKLLHKYGLYLILVAALTPVPFSGVAMLVGSIHYPIKGYFLWSLSRFAKFALSAYVIWEANMI
jgi:membrane protein YqaA with SNARE-associated domain